MASQATKVVKQAVSTEVGQGADVLVVRVAQDYYLADAQYKVLVDGVQVGDVYSASATVNSGTLDTLTLNGNWGSGTHNVQVVFLNDAADKSTQQDRNLLVSSVTMNGTSLGGDGKWLFSNGARTFTGSVVSNAVALGAVTPPANVGSDQLVLKLAQDYHSGDNAKFTVSVDGVQVGGVYSAAAIASKGQQDTLKLNGDWGAGTHTVSINFLNDAYTAATHEDRNLLIEGATLNGIAVAGAAKLMYQNGVYSFLATIVAVGGAAPSVPATHDIFDYSRAEGAQVITSFSATGDGSDVLRLDNYGLVNGKAPAGSVIYTSFDDLKGHISQSGADTVIKLSATDVVTLKNVNASDLTASNFVFASTLDGAMKVDTNNGWIVFNNTWGSGDYTYGKDYTLTAQYDINHLATGTTFTWDYGDARYGYTKVLGYPSVMYGSDTFYNAGGISDPTKALPVQVASLDKFTTTYSVNWGGDAKGYDVSYDIWLTNKPNGIWSDVTNEVMIWLHKGGMGTFGDLVGTYSDGTYSAKIYHTGNYTALVPDQDYTAGSVNIADVFKALAALGIVSGKEYVNQIDLGAEPWEGSGSLTINKLNYDITSHDATGVVTVAHADGGATQIARTGTANADTITGDGAKIATLTGGAGNDTFVFTKGQTGAVTVTDFHAYTTASAEHDTLNLTGYGSGATLTHDSGDNWTVHYSGGEDHLVLQGVTSLSASDYHFI